MQSRPLLLLGTIVALYSGAAVATERPVVVELFTSQGCSSCPPADAYLNDLSKQRADVLALAFHVTYWDYLGWKDPFSLRAATDRQARYGARFGDGSYTPEIVVDGAAGLVGSYRDDVNRAIAKAKAESATVADVRVIIKDGKASIDVGKGQGSARVLLVGFDREHVTPVGRGEPGPDHSRVQRGAVRFGRSRNGMALRSISSSSFRTVNRLPSSWNPRTVASSAPPGPAGAGHHKGAFRAGFRNLRPSRRFFVWRPDIRPAVSDRLHDGSGYH